MVLVTGAAGFVGTALCKQLRSRGFKVTGAVRTEAKSGQFNVGDLSCSTDWRTALAGCDVVIHLAARVHVMSDAEADPLRSYREVNVLATVNLARQALQAGVRRFVFVSSVKVNGEATTDKPFTANDIPAPCDPYGQSKYEAEQALLQLARESDLEVVIVRPPLIYGPGVKANFLNLVLLVKSGIPLPFGSICNSRSMVALDNLVDLLIVCSQHPAARSGTFMVSDGHDLSTAQLVRMIAHSFGRRCTMFSVPPTWLIAFAGLLGRAHAAERLVGSLQVDISYTQRRLNWAPAVTPQTAIDQIVVNMLKQAN